MSRRRSAAAFAAAVVLLTGTACDSGGGRGPGQPPKTGATSGGALTFGVYGPEDELAAHQVVVDEFNALTDGADVSLKTWPDHEGMLRALKSGDPPDVFLASRGDLARLQEDKLIQPVDVLLDERGVDFGDGYSRAALLAFSSEARLQCMPYGISPMVIYYNTELVDFERMTARGLPSPSPDLPTQWGFEAFTAAAEFATRPGRGTRGLYVEPTLQTLAPYIYAGGGAVFDAEDEPTSLAFSDGDTRAALARALELLRNPQLTLTQQQLEKRSALAWFKRGKLGMIQGFRSLVPELRPVHGLDFDVIPMPSLDQAGTVGDVTGICMSADASSAPQAADLIVHLVSAPSVQRVVRAGYLAPANLEVALSDDFLQPGRDPEHATVYNTAVRSMVQPPLVPRMRALQEAVGPLLEQLLSVSVLTPEALDLLTEEIDSRSRTVLAPESATPTS